MTQFADILFFRCVRPETEAFGQGVKLVKENSCLFRQFLAEEDRKFRLLGIQGRNVEPHFP